MSKILTKMVYRQSLLNPKYTEITNILKLAFNKTALKTRQKIQKKKKMHIPVYFLFSPYIKVEHGGNMNLLTWWVYKVYGEQLFYPNYYFLLSFLHKKSYALCTYYKHLPNVYSQCKYFVEKWKHYLSWSTPYKRFTSREHTYIILTPSNPIFI